MKFEKQDEKNKKPIAVIIGGGQGIGEATSIIMASRKWQVIIVDIDEKKSKKIAQKLGTFYFNADISNEKEMYTVSKKIEKNIGPVQALVVAAAIFQNLINSEDLRIEYWKNIIETNLTGTFIANKIFAKKMITRKKGSIVNISSIAALGSMPVQAYGTSKAGVVHLTKNLAGEWGRLGIRVNCVSPGSTLVERVKKRIKANRYDKHPSHFTATGKILHPNEIAEVIEFLCSEKSSGITGVNIPVDGGWHVATSWAQFGGLRTN